MKKNNYLFYILSIVLFTFSSHLSAKTYNWKLAQTWEKGSPLEYSVTRFIELSNQLSSGQLKITVDTQSEHKRPFEIFDMVKSGEYQMGHSESNYWRKKDRNTLFFSSVPFGMIAPELYSWFYHGDGMDLMGKVYSKYGLLSFPGGNSGNQMMGWFQREVECLANLKGLTMRMTGIAGEVMRNVGVNVIDIPSKDLYDALDTGKVDAVGYIGPAIDFDLGFYKIAPYYYTGWHAPSSEMQFLINETAFKKLPETLQNIVTHSMRLAAYDMYTKITHENGVKLNQIKRDFPNIKFRALPNSVTRRLIRETSRLMRDIAEQGDELTKEIMKSMEAHKKKSRKWTRVGEQAYLNNSIDTI
jgi:TRAP-type mannitol/chloroaromatic compound transport system substrate-binding protein